MSDQAIKNLALAIQQHPDEIKGLLKRNGVFTPDNADLPTLNKMTLAALGSSETFRNDLRDWTQSKMSSFSNVNGGDPVIDSATTGGTTSGQTDWGPVFKFLGDTTVAGLNYLSARQQTRALQEMNEAQGGTTGQNDGVPAVPPQSGGISTTKILLIVGLVGVVGGTIYYFTRK
jgi:hypothetical protein